MSLPKEKESPRRESRERYPENARMTVIAARPTAPIPAIAQAGGQQTLSGAHDPALADFHKANETEAHLPPSQINDSQTSALVSEGPPALPRPEAIWRARAVRYATLYLLLTVAVLVLRYTTQGTYPQLRELRQEVIALQTQRDSLELQVQQLTTGPRVLDWAKANGMVPYAQARKQSQDFPALPAPPTPMPTTAVEMTTQWKP